MGYWPRDVLRREAGQGPGVNLPTALQPKEQAIVTAILQLLRFKGIPHTHVRNSGRIARGAGGRIFFARDPLSILGVADVIACWKGRAIAIEVKSATGRIRPEQIQWLRSWEKSGGLAIVARSVGAVEAWLDQMPMTGAYQPMVI